MKPILALRAHPNLEHMWEGCLLHLGLCGLFHLCCMSTSWSFVTRWSTKDREKTHSHTEEKQKDRQTKSDQGKRGRQKLKDISDRIHLTHHSLSLYSLRSLPTKWKVLLTEKRDNDIHISIKEKRIERPIIYLPSSLPHSRAHFV